MCHGAFSEQRAAIIVPDLLRNQCYQIPDDSSKKEEQETGYNIDVLEPLEISEEVFADIVGKRFDDSEDVDIVEADAFASTGSLSTWFDCIKDDFGVVATTDDKKTVDEPVKEKAACKSRKARKSAVKESVSHAQHDSEMDDGTPVLIDEKRKRRMSSNRASAQRSRQRKQERLDELEILTAQLRLENATLSRRSKIAEQLAKRFEAEKNELAKKVADLSKELEAARHLHSDSGDESNASDNMVGGETPEKESVKRNISSTDLFQELYEAIDSDQFDVCLGAEEMSNLLQEEWLGSFTECLNAA